jgi:ribosomal protein L14
MHPAQHTCYMALHAQNPAPATGDHWAVIDSGTSKHVLLEHIYLVNATEDHTAVAGFSGQTSRATHRGDFTATVRTATGKLLHITDVDSALVIPDAIRTLYSVRKSLQSGNTIRFDTNAGLLVNGQPEFFVPFIRDSSTDLFLLPLLVPPTRHNGVYGIYNATTTPQDNPSGINLLKQAQTTAEKSSAQKQYLTDHHRLGHVQQQRLKDINVEGIKSSANASCLTQAAPPASHPKVANPIVPLPRHLSTEQ